MFKVLAYVGAVWAIVIIVILLMLAVSPAMDQIAGQSANEIALSANSSQVPGIEGAIRSYSVWKWGLPVLLGLGVTGWIFYKNREELRRRNG
jgi:hypothetical protein